MTVIYRFHLENSKNLSTYWELSPPDRWRLWIKKYCKSLTKKKNITNVLRMC